MLIKQTLHYSRVKFAFTEYRQAFSPLNMLPYRLNKPFPIAAEFGLAYAVDVEEVGVVLGQVACHVG